MVLHDGRFSRIYLAELRVDGAAPVTQFALKVQTDLYKPPAHGHRQAMTNADIDELWQREVADLARIDSPHVVGRVPVPPGLLDSLPIVHCRKADSYFHPVCAETGDLLTVCRDDEFLADQGLLKYSEDTWRYLYSRGGERTSRTFYRVPGANGERPRQGIRVRLGTELFRDWRQLVHPVAGREAAAAKATGVLPCLSCEHRATCYPAATDAENGDPGRTDRGSGAVRIPAEDHLHPVSFYDFRSLPLQLLDLDFDQLCDLLGGADLAEVAANPSCQTAQRQLLTKRTATFGAGLQWLFAGDPRRFPLEVLRLKLTAFQEVCGGLRALHMATGRPHFGVAPQNVMARLVPSGRGTPARWGFQVQLVDLGGPVRFTPPGRAEGTPCLLEPGPELQEDLRMRPYYSPELQGLDGQSSAMSVVFRPAETKGDKVRLVFEAQGIVNLKRYRVGDYVCITPAATMQGGDLSMWARIDELRQKGLLASVEVDKGSPCSRWAGRSLDAKCAFFRNFGPPVDLYGLGMLLFRTLLGNDQQSMDDIEDVVGKCLRRLRDELSGGMVDERVAAARVLQFVAGKEVRARFESQNVLHRRDQRVEYQRASVGDREPIDHGVWQSLLLVAFKLTTQFKGFSYSDSHAEGSPFLLRQVQADIEAVRRRLHVEMFAAEARDAAVTEVCGELLEQLRSELLASPDAQNATGGASARRAAQGFRLTVQKDGDPAVQEANFTREQVTLGRKEVDNLVRLADPMVSSAHAVIEKQADGYVVIDRNSMNGTEVDGIRLPGDVPQPLQDGSVIRIRPFTITFHTGSDRLNATAVVQMVTADQLLDQIQGDYAARLDAPIAEQRDGLRQVLLKARSAVGPGGLLALVEEVVQRIRRGRPDRAAEGAGGKSPVSAKLFTSAHKALSQLSKALVGPGEFRSAEEVERFVQKLGGLAEETMLWAEKATVLVAEVLRQFELQPSSGHSSVSGMSPFAEWRPLLLQWAADGGTVEAARTKLGKFFLDTQVLLEVFMEHPKTVRRAIRERLDPERLVDKIGRGFVSNMAAGSSLWKLYVEVFQDVAEGVPFQLELDKLLQRSLQERRAMNRKP